MGLSKEVKEAMSNARMRDNLKFLLIGIFHPSRAKRVIENLDMGMHMYSALSNSKINNKKLK